MYYPSIPSFFKPFTSFEDVRNQLKVPLIGPIDHLATALHRVISLLDCAYQAVINLGLGDFSATGTRLYWAGKCFSDIPCYIIAAIIEPILGAVALITRTIATLVCLVDDSAFGMLSNEDSAYSNSF